MLFNLAQVLGTIAAAHALILVGESPDQAVD
ncbi:hypothetical protein MELE44368_20505 [Mycolicibacterium elephantis DSM 44368]|uniref:Uncharacterized protein n=1 Tax=Mycolicibacterium elephantis DSM 44368 TaxID=1335622 RepID=A0A439DTH6_9MYCO|nr:hypothetical protein MELE44368_20505 [Mycolicibacterium elephantis DSM 44368]